jgi:hypothetical protein
MPDPTDFVTDLPADFEIFGDAVDTTLEAIETKLDVITTEGDLVVGDASGDPVRVPVGTAGQVLASDGDTVEWVNAAGGAPPYLNRIVAGEYLTTPNTESGIILTTGNLVTNTTFYTPIYLPSCTLDRISLRSGTHSVTGNTRLGIYNNGITNLPTTVLLDAGVVSVTSASANFEITISQVVSEGWYWLAINRQGGTYGLPRSDNSRYPLFNVKAGTLVSLFTSVQNLSGFSQTSVSGAFATAGTLVRQDEPFTCAVRIG